MKLFSYILSQPCSLLVYRKTAEFHKLIVYPAILLKLFMVSRSFGVEFFTSFRYKIMSFANRDSLTTSLLICVAFISSSYILALDRNSKTMLNKSVEIGHPCLVPNFRGNNFCFSPLSTMLAIGLSYMAFIMLRYFLLFLVSSELLL
jgi:hypothetical protein